MCFLVARPQAVPAVVASIFLMLAVGNWPYEYYKIMRWVVFLSAAFVAYNAFRWNRWWAVPMFLVIAIVLNPVAPLHLSRPTWLVIDALAAALFLLAAVGISAKTAIGHGEVNDNAAAVIEYACSECGAAMESPAILAGEMEVCQGCGSTIEVPRPTVLATRKDSAGKDPFPPRLRNQQAGSLGAELLPLDSSRRYIGGVLAYWVYWLSLWGVVTNVAGATLFSVEARKLVEAGTLDSIWDYGWGDHYICWLIAFCPVVGLCAALTGAIAKKNGPIIASIANVPVAVGLALWAYWHYTGRTSVQSPIAWAIVATLAFVGSLVAALIGGQVGEEGQEREFAEGTVLGIHPLHWSWIWLPAGAYTTGLAVSVVSMLVYGLSSYDMSTIDCLYFLLVLIPVLAFGYPVYLMYSILSGGILAKEGIGLKVLTFIGIWIGGLPVGWGAYWLCMKVLSWILG